MKKLKTINVKLPGKESFRLNYSPWFRPYTSGKTNLDNWTSAQTGAYVIRSRRTGKILYVGFSLYSLYKILYRHFQSWDDPTQKRAVYGKYHVWVCVITAPKAHLKDLETYLINKLNPRDNVMKYKESLLPYYRPKKSEDPNDRFSHLPTGIAPF